MSEKLFTVLLFLLFLFPVISNDLNGYNFYTNKFIKGVIMPLIRIDVPEGVSTVIKKQIHSKVREVVLKTFFLWMLSIVKYF